MDLHEHIKILVQSATDARLEQSYFGKEYRKQVARHYRKIIKQLVLSDDDELLNYIADLHFKLEDLRGSMITLATNESTQQSYAKAALADFEEKIEDILK